MWVKTGSGVAAGLLLAAGADWRIISQFEAGSRREARCLTCCCCCWPTEVDMQNNIYFSSSLVLQWNQNWQMWDFSKPETISVEHRLDLHQKPEEASSFYISPTNNPFHKHFGLSQIRINLCDTKTIFIPLDVNITWICFYRINHQKVWSSQQKQSSWSTGLGGESPSSRGMMVTISYQGWADLVPATHLLL